MDELEDYRLPGESPEFEVMHKEQERPFPPRRQQGFDPARFPCRPFLCRKG